MEDRLSSTLPIQIRSVINKINNMMNKILNFSQKYKVTTKFLLCIIMILLIIIIGLLLKIYNFKILFYYYVFLILIHALNIYFGPNKYLNIIFSESNIIIKLVIPILMFILIDYNQTLVSICKFIFILAIRFCFATVLSFSTVFFLLAFCLVSGMLYPIISSYLFAICIFHMNPENTSNSDQHRLPNWYSRVQQEQDF